MLQVRHQLLDRGFATTFTVKNPGQTPLPFCIGAHTAIRCPLFQGERFEDYALVFDRSEDADTLLLTPQGLLRDGGTEPMLRDGRIYLDYADFQRLDTLIFQGLASGRAELRHRGKGHGVSLDFHEFPMVAFWTMAKADAPYICLEPWQGCAAWEEEDGEFAGKRHAVRLAPGEEKRLAYTVELC